MMYGLFTGGQFTGVLFTGDESPDHCSPDGLFTGRTIHRTKFYQRTIHRKLANYLFVGPTFALWQGQEQTPRKGNPW